MIEKINKRQRPIVAVLFLCLLLFGLLATPGYGMPWDELLEIRTLGSNVREYVGLVAGEENEPTHSKTGIEFTDYLENVDMDHGQSVYYPFAPLLFADLGEDAPRTLMFLFHGYTFLVFMAGVAALYCIAKSLTSDWKYGVAAALMMYLSPRFFAEGHYNSKDIIAMALWIICIWLGMKMISTRRFRYGVAMAFASAVSTNMRMTGIGVFGLIGILYLVNLSVEKEWSRKHFAVGLTSLLSFFGFLYVLSPAMWRKPIDFISYVISRSSNFADWEGFVFFQGTTYRPVPWYYIPVMFAVTTPILIIMLFVFSHFAVIHQAIKAKWRGIFTGESQYYLMCLFIVWLFLGFAMIRRPIFYNSWRHMYFLYGPIIILCVGALKWLVDHLKGKGKSIAVIALAAQLTFSGILIIAVHPNQHVYFNFLAGANPSENYEYDYWNVSQMNLLQQIANQDDRTRIYVYADDWYAADGLKKAHDVLKKADRDRIVVLSYEGQGVPVNANYLVVNPMVSLACTAKGGYPASRWFYVQGKYDFYKDYEKAVSIRAFGNDFMTAYIPE
ncbi:MAG TPA: hypothetical protein GXZ67_06535 [Clostridiaceae bacterium]|jgi:hypothetical protein|nr:hypothetical protein [Clostridiaceae bacterium]